MRIFDWIDQIEIIHIIYVAVVSASLFVVGFFGEFYLIELLELEANIDAETTISLFHNIVIGSGVTFLIICGILLVILMEVS